MIKKLMIVESGEKGKSIKAYLSDIDKGSSWDVEPCYGHIQDLNSDKKGVFGSLGVNKATLEMDYQLSSKGADIVSKLKAKMKKNNYARIVIATDLDREGEAIAEHLRDRLKLKESDYDRCTFNEITKDAIKRSLDNPRKVDKNLIKAQDTRRILDRVVGWEASTAISRAANKKTPMGRVISQAVRMVVIRENERNNFVAQEHYGVQVDFGDWSAKLDLKQSGLLEDLADEDFWKDKELADKIAARLKGESLAVIDSSQETKDRYAPPPFETSTMQQAAMNKLKWKAKKCDSIAQKLYQDGHITYIRTDSTVISDTAFDMLKKYGLKKGYKIVDVKREGKKGKVDQEAHECIRPSSFEFDGEGLGADEKKLYDLIKTRCLASQMEAAQFEVTTLTLATDDDYIFKASGSIQTRKGWKELLSGDDSGDEEKEVEAKNPVPLKKKGEEVIVESSSIIISTTTKPERLTQVTLGAMLKKNGIGRPSTYANVYEKIGMDHHGYVNEKGHYYEPSEHAEQMVKLTQDDLCIMDTAFTMSMEDHLDDIANGKIENDVYIYNFFERLEENLETILKKNVTPDSKCLECGENTLRRIPRKSGDSYFWGCRNNECGATFSDADGKPIDFDKEFLNDDGTPKFPCPNCKKHLIKIQSKKNKKYWWICSDKEKDKEKKCNFIAANNDKNEPDFEAQKSREEWRQKIKDAHDEKGDPIHPCPECGKALIMSTSKKGDNYFKCSAKKADCDYYTMADDDNNPKEK